MKIMELEKHLPRITPLTVKTTFSQIKFMSITKVKTMRMLPYSQHPTASTPTLANFRANLSLKTDNSKR